MSKPKCGRVLNPTSGDIAGFINVYKTSFGGEPYCEEYTDAQVMEVLDEHIVHGRIILAHDAADKVVGLGCSLPLRLAPSDVQEFMEGQMKAGNLPSDMTPSNTWYMSELAVSPDHRKQGIAYDLVRHRLIDVSHANAMGGTGKYYIMRTAAFASNSLHLYTKIGAKRLPVLQDVSLSEQVLTNKSQSTQRVYLWGTSSDALSVLTRKLDPDSDPSDGQQATE